MHSISSLQGAEGRALGLSVIEELVARGLSVSAENYELWLAYRLGLNPHLTRAIESASSISQALCDQLLEKHLNNGRVALSLLETGDSIARELADILACLRESGKESRSYGALLRAAGALDAGDVDPALFRAMVRDLAAATRAMSARNQSLTTQIEQSSQQMQILQAALAHVKAEALTDELTGVANRRCFEMTLQRMLAAPVVENFGVSLVLCDIDHFKRINDTYGHPVGDQVIRFVAHVLAKTAPKKALVARYGGEEFAIILTSASEAEATRVAEAARHALRGQKIFKRSTGQFIGAITASFGVAVQTHGDDAMRLLERADKRLYAAKALGRDRVVAHDLTAEAA